MDTESSVDDVLKHLGRGRNGRVVFICDEDGKLTGLISKRDIKNAASERKHWRQSTSPVVGIKY